MNARWNPLIAAAIAACTSTPFVPHAPDPTAPIATEPTAPTEPTDPPPDDPTAPRDPPEPPSPSDCDMTAVAGADLAAAAASVADGGTLCLGTGVHPDGLSLDGRTLTVEGLSGTSLRGAISVSGGKVILRALTFEDTSGGPAVVLTDTTATLEQLSILRGAAATSDASGGLESRDTDLTVNGLSIVEVDGTGAVVVGGSLSMNDALIRDCGGTYTGALIAARLTEATLTHVRIENNEGPALVGGVELRLIDLAHLERVDIIDNLSVFEVGGLYAKDLGELEILDSSVLDNDGGFTGGLEVWNVDELVVDGLTVRGNGSVGPSVLGGLAVANIADLQIRDLVIDGNRGSLLPGGGMVIAATGSLDDVVVSDNQSEGPTGGLVVSESDLVVRHLDLRENVGTDTGGLYCNTGAVSLFEPTFRANTPSPWSSAPECTVTIATSFGPTTVR